MSLLTGSQGLRELRRSARVLSLRQPVCDPQHRLHPLLVGALVGLGFIEHDRSRISAQCLPDAGLCGVASDDETHVTEQGGDIAAEHFAFAGP